MPDPVTREELVEAGIKALGEEFEEAGPDELYVPAIIDAVEPLILKAERARLRAEVEKLSVRRDIHYVERIPRNAVLSLLADPEEEKDG